MRRPAPGTRSGACARRPACASSTSRPAFTLEEYDPGLPLQVGPFEVAFQPVPHFLPTQAVEFAADGRRLTYSADSAPSDDLCAFARDTDLLLIEATLPRPEREGPRGHLTPGEAGDHGRRAGARRLVLTHISDELDAEWARREAERSFGGPVEIAHEGAVYTSESLGNELGWVRRRGSRRARHYGVRPRKPSQSRRSAPTGAECRRARWAPRLLPSAGAGSRLPHPRD